ncbi:hypothetical protein TheveDRAFT_0541 [Thermanaerovibrio velox DSM 12556]|uniref:eRF1 domain-containing protein n=1 Tax=Thermanaerovibrio velox DSM 12556 TaxID=926567 RepID=H0UQE8_9BACT|nr:hypothetical protein [Thermanaerovibrio velox]EHM09702.1 hypothetical protein TheveDRAFT_0541 [Thermanaerovibrio velox DSM 12556]
MTEIVLKILEDFDGEDRVLSLYMSFQGMSAKQASIELKNRSRGVDREFQQGLSMGLDELCDRFGAFKDLRAPRGVALFAAPGGRFSVLELPNPVQGEYVMDAPAVLPALKVLSPLRDVWLVLLRRGDARIFRFGNRLSEVDRLSEELIRPVKDAGFRGGEERRIERRSETSLGRFLKDLKWRIKELDMEFPCREVWLAASEELLHEALGTLREMGLPVHPMKPKGDDDPHRLEEDLREAMEKRFFQESEELVERILEGPSRSALGLRQVIDGVNRRDLMKLVIEDLEGIRGVRCGSCGALGIDEVQCPLCGGAMGEEEDLLEALSRRALRGGARVVVLGRPSALREHEGIGGLLRNPR